MPITFTDYDKREFTMNYLVVAKYKSKYGLILYVAKIREDEAAAVDMENVYLNTFYYKGEKDIQVGSTYSFQTIKGENGFTYCF